MSARFREIANRYTPPFIRIRWKRKKNGKVILRPAHACLKKEEILSPRPDTIEGLAYFLHECAHFWLRHFVPEEANSPKMEKLYTGGATETESQQEYEAEQWTISTLRREGLAVPDHVIEDMRRYVASCVRSERHRKIPRRVKRFIR